MKPFLAGFITFLLLLCALIGAYSSNNRLRATRASAADVVHKTVPNWRGTDSDVRAYISKMTPEEKAGQLLMFSFLGLSVNQQTAADIESMQLGGVIIMGENVQDKTQLSQLTKQLGSLALKVPPLIAVDEEGGTVKRLPWDNLPGPLEWRTMSTLEIEKVGKQRGDLLREVGINLNFAPTVDLSSRYESYINSRTISTNSAEVAVKTRAYVVGQESTGVAATLKHFPGHGATTQDSHVGVPAVGKSKSWWLDSDAVPYTNVPARVVMLGHLLFTNLDAKLPATQSEHIVNDILRGEIGFDGVVVTDDMGMLHDNTRLPPRELIKQAILAGSDILVYVKSPVSAREIYNEVLELVKSGEIPQSQVDLSLLRIFRLKQFVYQNN